MPMAVKHLQADEDGRSNNGQLPSNRKDYDALQPRSNSVSQASSRRSTASWIACGSTAFQAEPRRELGHGDCHRHHAFPMCQAPQKDSKAAAENQSRKHQAGNEHAENSPSRIKVRRPMSKTTARAASFRKIGIHPPRPAAPGLTPRCRSQRYVIPGVPSTPPPRVPMQLAPAVTSAGFSDPHC